MLDDISNPSSSSALTHDNFASLLFHAVNRYKALPSGVKRASRRKEEKFRLFFSSGFLAALPFLLLLLLLLLPHPSFHFLRLLFTFSDFFSLSQTSFFFLSDNNNHQKTLAFILCFHRIWVSFISERVKIRQEEPNFGCVNLTTMFT
ncbi:hypothetical protein PICMEDRAFT_158249 [Pichia membranifaciens NRRL Y-2026]|uniref:Transmembrane protein n=1 Tax=Pichia membranifaciens NRRL Y-2026 TaxID=763406 RepID=A0A1E3NI45_9ASCO|nr:hypothetical protein PICMEDRAFT_158249 [Pichia membranifaciens NRRL Y-2026]ODQ45013.1 hypothetical protein PICMEDRAFT_158249 [Pichia membranifaciens NRRL Y-2026]